MPLFAAEDLIACLLQFGVVGFFLFLSFISWVIKQTAARNAARGNAQQVSPRGAAIPSSNTQRQRKNPYEAEVLEAEVVSATDEPRLASTLSTKGLADHAAHLGQLDDRPAEKGVHDRFDDEVGRLGDSSDAIHEDPNAEKLPDVAVTTGEIIDVFRNPERIREAIVLNEILTPVSQRWD